MYLLHLTKYEMNKVQYNILSDLNIKSTKDTLWCVLNRVVQRMLAISDWYKMANCWGIIIGISIERDECINGIQILS